MNWRHAPPDAPPPPGASVQVPLFLLLVLVPPGGGCVFIFDPLSTTFSRDIDDLTQHLLHDYSVSIPLNLEPDGWCAELWRVHFLAVELRHMRGVAGTALQPLVAKVVQQDPTGCVGQERRNVSWMLRALNGHMAALKSKMAGQDSVDFSNCTPIRCQPEALALPPAPVGLPQPGFSSRKQPGTQASGAGSLHKNHLPVLLLLVPILGSLAFVSLWQYQRQLRGQLLLPSLPTGDPGVRAVGHLNEWGAGADRREMAQDPQSHGWSPCYGFWDVGGQHRSQLGPPEPDSASYTPLLRAKRRVESATPPGGLQG
ncbi:fms-related tyrosine kinase 3 ligand isoform X3 [Dermochelys coriacea]|uniref:fms-related tyrosine kinase 3 ligand isoform X3 n=1 Tax=Dermochelys coriacea TaxID=27794 RepID=UPI001CA997E5|nr:fms-related tyrosine kinase 3 ligand isoform X3 [Dermochelys coriacea]